jgi:drug/metabolite transporter (DMT)-like permease
MTTTLPSKLSIYLALGTGVLALGFSAIFIQWADAPGVVSAFYRVAIASVLMALPFYNRVKGQRDRLPSRGVRMAILGGIFFGMDLLLWATGITLGNATNPTLMANTAPLWVGLGAWLIFGERQSGIFWIGLALAMTGAMIVLGQDLTTTVEFGLGTFFGLLAAVFYGAYYLVTQQGRLSLDTLSYFWITAGSSTLLLLSITVIARQPLTGYDPFTILSFLASGIFVQVLGWLALNYAQGYLPASIVAPTLLIQPVLTAFFAYWLLGETFTIWHILGGATVLIGIYIIHRSRQEK